MMCVDTVLFSSFVFIKSYISFLLINRVFLYINLSLMPISSSSGAITIAFFPSSSTFSSSVNRVTASAVARLPLMIIVMSQLFVGFVSFLDICSSNILILSGLGVFSVFRYMS